MPPRPRPCAAVPGLMAVRVNPLDSEWGREDVEAMTQASPGSLVLPKVESPEEVAEADALIGDAPVGLQALIETAAGLVRAAEIARASSRLEALIIGFADLTASLGRPAVADYPGDRWHWVRETVLVAARSAGLQAIDGPHLDVGDLEGLAVEAGRARALGLDGKWVLHPAQIEPVNEVFSPGQEEVDRAGAILDRPRRGRWPRGGGPGRRDDRRGQPQAGRPGGGAGPRRRNDPRLDLPAMCGAFLARRHFCIANSSILHFDAQEVEDLAPLCRCSRWWTPPLTRKAGHDAPPSCGRSRPRRAARSVRDLPRNPARRLAHTGA